MLRMAARQPGQEVTEEVTEISGTASRPAAPRFQTGLKCFFNPAQQAW